jgi:hypothetical protein
MCIRYQPAKHDGIMRDKARFMYNFGEVAPTASIKSSTRTNHDGAAYPSYLRESRLGLSTSYTDGTLVMPSLWHVIICAHIILFSCGVGGYLLIIVTLVVRRNGEVIAIQFDRI